MIHIAICDDNVADRKQLERLLKRESTKRTGECGAFFADSFGNASALLANPMQYDAFYIDVCKTEGITGTDIANQLCSQGVVAPIIMCCSDINYREFTFPSQVTFLDKPIIVAQLSASLDMVQEEKTKAVPVIELREDKQTVYVTEPDILYAVEETPIVNVYLKDGRKVTIKDTSLNLFSQIEGFPSFFSPSNKVILNGRHIQKISFHKATMIDGKEFKIHRDCMEYAKYAFNEFHDK